LQINIHMFPGIEFFMGSNQFKLSIKAKLMHFLYGNNSL
jgi:hypothetical protein